MTGRGLTTLYERDVMRRVQHHVCNGTRPDPRTVWAWPLTGWCAALAAAAVTDHPALLAALAIPAAAAVVVWLAVDTVRTERSDRTGAATAHQITRGRR